MYIKVLNELRSLEDYHKSIVDIKERITKADIAYKYIGADKEKSNCFIYYKESLNNRPIKSLGKNKAMVESKQKLLNILNRTDLFQRQLPRKMKGEIEEARLMFLEIQNAFNASLNVQNQLYSQNTINNTKIMAVMMQMNSIGSQLENRNTDLKLTMNKLDKSIKEVSKEIFLDFEFKNNEKNLNKDTMNSEFSSFDIYKEITKIIESLGQTNVPIALNPFTQRKSLLHDVNWADVLLTHNIANESFLIDLRQNSNKVTCVNTLMNNINYIEQEFISNLKNTISFINNVRTQRDLNTRILKQLNDELSESKKKNKLMMGSYQKNNNLEAEYIKNIRNLDNTIHKSCIQLTVTTKYIKKCYDDLQCLDSSLQTTSQKYTDQSMSVSYLEELRDGRQSNKVTSLYEKLKTNENRYNELVINRKEIIMDEIKRKKSTARAIVKKKSNDIVESRNTIASYENYIKIYKTYIPQLVDINASIENAINDLNHQNTDGQLEQLENEETELKSSINLYYKEIDKLNKEDEILVTNSKRNEINIKTQINNLNEKLQQITIANASLEMEIK